jgi:hypothetical protein
MEPAQPPSTYVKAARWAAFTYAGPYAVPNAFLDIEDQDASVFPPIDQMKIQKLLFYAHAWFLAHVTAPCLMKRSACSSHQYLYAGLE